MRRTFVFLGSRCTQPLTPRNAHALRYEIFKMADRPKREIKKTKRFCNEYSTYKVRINKARVAFNMLRKVWSSHVISRRTKFRIFNTNVKAVLLYGSETWRTTKQTSQKLQIFVNKCLRRILKISWTDRVTNEMLWELAGEEPIITQISKRKWRWIGHILRKPANNITRQALRWNPQGKRKRGRPRNSWRRGVESQMRN